MRHFLICLGLAAAALGSYAQDAPWNATEVGNWDEAGQQFSDVWGEGDFAYMAHKDQRVVSIVDIVDPANPVLASRYDTDVFTSAQDVKTHQGLMFVGMENASPGCQIVDVRDPYNPVKLTDVTAMTSVHNVFYDEGWLYLVDSGTNRIEIVDLRTYDINDPPATISDSTWTLDNVGNQFVHDITVANGRLYASAWDSLRVYDVSDNAIQAPVFLGSTSGDNVHAAWPTDDGRFVVTADEKSGGGLTLYEIFDDGADSVVLEARDYFFLPSGVAGTAHNVLIDDYRLYASYYAAGVQVLEIDPTTASWFLVASFDTTPDDGNNALFSGCWGVYPFLGPDKILASDRVLGLSVLDVQPNVLDFRPPHVALPIAVAPDSELRIHLLEVGSPVAPGTVTAHLSVAGGPFHPQVLSLEEEGGEKRGEAEADVYLGSWPNAPENSQVEVYFTAENQLGDVFTYPVGGADNAHRTDIHGDGPSALFADPFQTDLGWTVDNSGVFAGGWERGSPRGTGPQPEFDALGNVDGSCYFTQQGSVGGSQGEADVDGGPAYLTSPPIDLDNDGTLAYAYWLFNNNQDGDPLVVEISSDGTTWVEARRYQNLLGSWRRDSLRVGDFVEPTDRVQIRFSIADLGDGSITEAAIDSVVAYAAPGILFSDNFELGDLTAWSAAAP